MINVGIVERAEEQSYHHPPFYSRAVTLLKHARERHPSIICTAVSCAIHGSKMSRYARCCTLASGPRGSPSGRHVPNKRVRRGSVPHISFCKGFLHVLFVCAYYTAKKAACSKTFQTFCFVLNTISLFIVCSIPTTRCSVRRMGKGPLKTSRKREGFHL